MRSACMSVCLSVCLTASSHIKKSHVQTSRNFLYTLPVAVARSCCDNSALCYVLPVLWMTSWCFHIIRHTWCTVMHTAEECQSTGGNADRGGASVLQLCPCQRCLPLTGFLSRKPFGHNEHGRKIGGCAFLGGAGSPSDTMYVDGSQAYLHVKFHLDL